MKYILNYSFYLSCRLTKTTLIYQMKPEHTCLIRTVCCYTWFYHHIICRNVSLPKHGFAPALSVVKPLTHHSESLTLKYGTSSI